ncbi:MAG TPA: L-seryl-tRNA(Sec) selenium transferase [Capsulimonadaceae bacterium]|nr:L-seryl-tRNA(Sec) selenium transferase [Capsulimonadaceae bacterium]
MPKPEAQSPSLRQIPKVHTLLEMPEALALAEQFGRETVAEAIREEIDGLRRRLLANDRTAEPPTRDSLLQGTERRLAEGKLARLQPVINGTGIILHTNMGRAPLADEAIRAIQEVAGGYSNLELDLASGRRGERGGETEALLQKLTGAEAALVVNNNAAGVLLALTTLAQGAQVIISRGELVEIGGAFRVPDVIAQSGATLVEVGTTNKTRLSDYSRAITEETRILLKVHPSNYRIVGFTSEVGVKDLEGLAREHGLILMQDLGSGALVDLARWGLPHEPTVQETLSAGADVVTVSGDKLLGGPQCGIVLGKAEYIRRMGQHPLFRALRPGKIVLGALEATLRLYLDDSRLMQAVPTLRMLSQGASELARRAQRLSSRLAKIDGLSAVVTDGEGFAGGGALPEMSLPTKQVRITKEGWSAGQIADALRRARRAIVGMIADGVFILDVRTIQDREVAEIALAFARLSP